MLSKKHDRNNNINITAMLNKAYAGYWCDTIHRKIS